MKRAVAAFVALCCADIARAEQVDLSGWYGGVGASIGYSTEVQINCDLNSCYRWPPSSTDHLSYGGHVFVGRNTYIGDWIGGFEFGTSFDFRKAKATDRSETVHADYDNPIAWGWSSIAPENTTVYYTADGGFLRRDYAWHYSMSKQVSPTLSFRAGRQFGGWFIYGKGGAGAAIIEELESSDDFASVYCGRSRYRIEYGTGGYHEMFNDECLEPYHGSTQYTRRHTTVAPVGLVAIGAEKHFDHFFLRGEAEVRHTFLNNRLEFGRASGLTTYQTTIGLGIKF